MRLAQLCVRLDAGGKRLNWLCPKVKKKHTTTLMLSDCQSSDAVSSLFHLCMDLQASDFLGNNLPDLDSLQARWYQTWQTKDLEKLPVGCCSPRSCSSMSFPLKPYGQFNVISQIVIHQLIQQMRNMLLYVWHGRMTLNRIEQILPQSIKETFLHIRTSNTTTHKQRDHKPLYFLSNAGLEPD